MPISHAAIVDTIGLRIQDLHASGQLADDQPLLRIDNREQAREAPFQFDAALGRLHRTGCPAIPSGSRSALYGVWDISAQDPALACPRCSPKVKPAAAEPEAKPKSANAAGRLPDDPAVDMLYGLLSVFSQFGGVLCERGQEYRRSRAGAAIGDRIEKIYAGVNEQERRILDILTLSIGTFTEALRDIDGGLNGERPGEPNQDKAR